jgi:predicted SnoaL-like aldol condensation-catalyzing enzyme
MTDTKAQESGHGTNAASTRPQHSSRPGGSGHDASGRLEANKKLVWAYYDLAFNQQKPEEAVAKYQGPMYIQHNPQAPDGAEAFIRFVKGFTKQFPDLKVHRKRIVAEGDLVVVHSNIVPDPAGRGLAAVDIFRLEDGKIVEHWDVLQDVPEKAANDNTMF